MALFKRVEYIISRMEVTLTSFVKNGHCALQIAQVDQGLPTSAFMKEHDL